MFWKLHGHITLRNVVIVTNMWEQVNPDVSNEREAKLKNFFKSILENAARRGRHENAALAAETNHRLTLCNRPDRSYPKGTSR